ncbi:substrate-binding domain-containing protein [Verrucomicrobiaceae bacterium N1E253]|uniref:Substrate-binding domain-containing protein n=1 Tax=Oceaniferula marina TaxID=2748318 RepID=A0A851GGR9_9BACT|nr:helix-turn-helix domain-containing protein [Oceaniferula marina]NWK56556.1 substrate-binding domain-containing protein [Oceaniferula marina]
MQALHTIGLLCPRGFKFYTYEAVAGMVNYGEEQLNLRLKDLRFQTLSDLETLIPKKLENHDCSGLILGLNTNEYTKIKNSLPTDIPRCNIHPDILSPDIPTVAIDLESLAHKAVDYFNRIGFKNIGLLRSANTVSQDEVYRHLQLAAAAHGMDCFQHASEPPENMLSAEELPTSHALKQWLSELPKPIAILTSGGFSALILSRAAAELNISIPDELSILSESDDEACLFTERPVSSIRSAGPLIGYKALQLIHQAILQGEKIQTGRINLPAPPIIERSSTGLPQGMNQQTKDVIRYIRKNALNGISVSSILSAFPNCSRSKLYREFDKYLGYPPAEEILRLQINKAKELIAYSSMSVSEIAQMCGFSNQSTFSSTFSRVEGQSPSQWRKSQQH